MEIDEYALYQHQQTTKPKKDIRPEVRVESISMTL